MWCWFTLKVTNLIPWVPALSVSKLHIWQNQTWLKCGCISEAASWSFSWLPRTKLSLNSHSDLTLAPESVINLASEHISVTNGTKRVTAASSLTGTMTAMSISSTSKLRRLLVDEQRRRRLVWNVGKHASMRQQPEPDRPSVALFAYLFVLDHSLSFTYSL